MAEKKSIPFGHVVLLVNLSHIFYTGMWTTGQDMLQRYGVGVLELSFARALITLCLTYVNVLICK